MVAYKKVTSEMGTQVEQEKQQVQQQVTKSVSVENLSSPTTSSKKNKSKSSSSGCLLLETSKKTGHSESSDPICASSGTQKVKKWSYTNGRTS